MIDATFMSTPLSPGEFDAARRACEQVASWPDPEKRSEGVEATMDVLGRYYLEDRITAEQRDELYKILHARHESVRHADDACPGQPRLPLPALKPQAIPLDHPDSNCMFRPGPDKPFVATSAAIELYGNEVIVACLRALRDMADRNRGGDYLQVFEDPSKSESLWFIEDGNGGAITALLPSDY
jgi:hypothetical protein